MSAIKTGNKPALETKDKVKQTSQEWQKSLWFAISGLALFAVSFRFAFLTAVSPENYPLSPVSTLVVLGLLAGWALLVKGFLVAMHGANRDKPRCSVISMSLALPMLATTISMITVLPVMFL